MSYYSKFKKEEKIVFLFNQLRQEDKKDITSLSEKIIKMNIEISEGDYFNKTQMLIK